MKSLKVKKRIEIDFSKGTLVESKSFPGLVVLVSPYETISEAHPSQFYGVYICVPERMGYIIGDMDLHKRDEFEFYDYIIQMQNK